MRSGGEAEVTKRKCEVKMSRLEREVQRARQLHQETQHQLKVRSWNRGHGRGTLGLFLWFEVVVDFILCGGGCLVIV